MPNVYDHGDVVRLRATFVASGGGVVAPASCYLLIRPPAGPVSTYGYPAGVSSAGATGCFFKDQLASWGIAGDWAYRFVGEPSIGQAAAETVFTIRQSSFLL